MIESPRWKQIRNEEGVLLYEGYTLLNKPHGTGRSFFSNGNVYQEGDFCIKGLINGKEYYPSGDLRFAGSFRINKAYGPNYPVNGKCYDTNGQLYYEGQIHCSFGGVGYPSVIFPEEYGPIVQKNKPDLPTFMWEDEEQFSSDKDLERDVSMTLVEFTTFVTQGFYRRVNKSEDSDSFVQSDRAQKVIRDNYKAFIDPEVFYGGFDPEATANCLGLMYE